MEDRPILLMTGYSQNNGPLWLAAQECRPLPCSIKAGLNRNQDA